MCTEECGRVEPPDERELVEAFRVVAQDTFAFLQPVHAFGSGRLDTYNLVDGQRVSARVGDLRFPFVAEVTFSSSDAEIVIRYGDREYELSALVETAAGGSHPLGAWLSVIESDDPGVATPWVVGPKGLVRHTRVLAQAVKQALPEILSSGPDARGRLEQSDFKSTANVGRIRDGAKQAFGKGDYRKAALLFVEIEDLLTSTEAKQLQFAQEKLAS